MSFFTVVASMIIAALLLLGGLTIFCILASVEVWFWLKTQWRDWRAK